MKRMLFVVPWLIGVSMLPIANYNDQKSDSRIDLTELESQNRQCLGGVLWEK